jgi:hypothetical protein
LVSLTKENGVSCVHNFREFKLCLLSLWIKRNNLSDNKIIENSYIYYKYNIYSPSTLLINDQMVSYFWKWVAWVINAATMSYKWKVGNGCVVNDRVDVWFG